MFRVTAVRFAESVSKQPLNLREASGAPLPPLSLYRRILRVHRNLPHEMRSLGDDYVKAEFRRHKETTNKVRIIGFLSQWKTYLAQLPTGPDGAKAFRGKPLDPTTLEKMSAEQLSQLYEVVTKDVWKPVTPEQDGRTGFSRR